MWEGSMRGGKHADGLGFGCHAECLQLGCACRSLHLKLVLRLG